MHISVVGANALLQIWLKLLDDVHALGLFFSKQKDICMRPLYIIHIKD